MLLKDYLSAASNVFSINRLLVVVTIVMAGVTVLQIRMLAEEKESRTTVVVPLVSTGAMEVGYDTASDDYLRAMARYVLNLAFTYTSDTARPQFEELLTLFAPEYREPERRRWIEVAERIEKVRRVSRAFYIDDIRLKDETRMIVRGTTVRRIGTTLEQQPATIEIGYRIRHGRFLIEHISRADGEAPKKPRETGDIVVQAVSGGDLIRENERIPATLTDPREILEHAGIE